MSQNDFSIANQGFPSFRTDLNSSLQALASNSSGDTEPSTTYAYQWWYDSTADVLKMRNADNDAWITFAAFDQTTDSWYFSGNVGIGTSSTAAKLDISGASSDQIRLRTAAAAETEYFAIGRNTSTGYLDFYGSQTGYTGYTFGGVNGEHMRIDSSGNLLVGKTAESTGVNGSQLFPQGLIQVVSTDADCGNFHRYGSDGTALLFLKATTAVGSISVTGSATSYNTSSDYRLKTDVQPMTGASARVQALNPVNFEWISSGERVDGFLAHEAQTVVPEAVLGTKDAMRDEEYEVTPAVLDDDGNVVTEAVMSTRQVPNYQGIDQSKLVPLLTAALQEALTEIADLKARVAALEV
tara:strand:+ start:1975 stop:3033 length:1059 start_codon:yes stop_codon:yes gene_type:complete